MICFRLKMTLVSCARHLTIFGLMFFTCVSYAQIRVVTSLPDLARMIEEIGKNHVEVTSLLRGNEDPHFADANPDFIRQVNRADVVCVVGLDLEIGWIPKVLAKSGNAKVQPGGKGYCEAGSSVKALDIPSGPINRAMGDVHASGNPHFYLSPLAMSEASEALTRALIAARPDLASEFKKNQAELKTQLRELHARMSKTLKEKNKGKQLLVIEYHKEFAYFLSAYEIKSTGTIEEKPGVPPSMGRLAQVALDAKKSGVQIALAASYSPEKDLKKFSDLSGIPYLKLPVSAPLDKKGFPALESLQLQMIQSLPELK